MAIDKLSIINDACAATGNNIGITTNDGSEEWDHGSRAYDIALPYLIDAHDWKFAEKTAVVAPGGVSSDPAFSAYYTKPSDLLHLIWVKQGGVPIVYQVMGNTILMGTGYDPASSITIKYLAQPDPAIASPIFQTALRSLVMSGIYRGLNEDIEEANKAWAAGEAMIARARERVDDETTTQARRAWPLDKLTIINDTMAINGERVFSQADDGSREWNTCSSAYEAALPYMLEAAEWKFAEKIATLTPQATAPDPSFQEHYLKPADLLHLVWAKQNNAPILYEVMGNFIMMGPGYDPTASIMIKYVAQPPPGNMTAIFQAALRKFIEAAILRGIKKDAPPDASDKAWAAGEALILRAKERMLDETTPQPRKAFPLDKLTIVNDALALSGERLITEKYDGSRAWNVASASYETRLAHMLQTHSWSFATKVATLSASLTPPGDPRFDTAYDRPTDALHLIWVRLNDLPVEYRVLNNQIILNNNGALAVTVEYVAQPASDLLPPMFDTALRTYMQADIFRGLKQPADLAEAMRLTAMAEKYLQEARTRADQEQPKRAMFNSRLRMSRRVRRPWGQSPAGWGMPGTWR